MTKPVTYERCDLPSCTVLTLSWAHTLGKYCSAEHRDEHQTIKALIQTPGVPAGHVGRLLADRMHELGHRVDAPAASSAGDCRDTDAQPFAQQVAVAAAPLFARIMRWMTGRWSR
ncbi:hypothetical protein Lesp02_84200 [Lentzea sp. NBRC 105346]|uniref:hypothetical protein n=1 Tax=Lentzea sp. NBRC 105346 TaxID=3032205 RepID=UPI0024A412E4|nr:hypothetical protein [Lentzea sp. NBRC 105346]GLZ36233.1 hypothetical protein Lesp02_84200 [Lentzea sp. NBRC 105346]